MAADRKKWILEAASKSFALFGYKATTMDQVAKIANVGKGTIYTFFSTKEELFDAIMVDVIQEMKRIADRAIKPELSFTANLQEVLSQVLEFRGSHELLIKLHHEIQEMGTPAAEEGMLKLENAVLTFLEVKVQEAVDRKEIRPCDPQIAAFVMLRLYVSFVYDWERKHEPLTKEKIAELFQQFLFEGLAVR
ncbi:TetR/AcrR family transcriptional regulator [Gorillibacterium sp. sgz5001074]|uniref:TetR/AcrR family transcriptional regulator n=1 Tax=Gorillibacterium sp. sgz5001074 TaxID=3446695 RepID=UPI003F6757DC